MYGKHSTKTDHAERIKRAVELVCKGGNVKKFFQKPPRLYEEAKLNDGANFGPIEEFFKFCLRVLHFLFLKKQETYYEVKENFLEYGENVKEAI